MQFLLFFLKINNIKQLTKGQKITKIIKYKQPYRNRDICLRKRRSLKGTN